MDKRRVHFNSKQHLDDIGRYGGGLDAVDFFNVLTGPQLLNAVEEHLPEHRERIYPPTVVLSMFIKQVLDADGSCQRAVNGWAAQRVIEGLSAHSVRTGAYCRARQRLPSELARVMTRESGRVLGAHAEPAWRWRRRAVKLVDGTGVSMPDTPANQACYPQPSSQAPGVGFPQARVVGVVCLSSGAVVDAAMGPMEGKGHGESSLLRTVVDAFEPGDVMLADALYASYWLVAEQQARGVDVLFEQHGSRSTDFRRGHRLSTRDHIVKWTKPRERPQWMSAEQHAQFPDEIEVRETKVDGRILVTTMLEPRKVGKRALSKLYAQRWNVELDIRNIKTTMGMEVLRCQTPEMIEKEFWVNLLAYNLIRLLMAQAARESGLEPRKLSFKHTVQVWTQWTQLLGGTPVSAYRDDLLHLIAQITVGDRPGRIEPRAQKRRPKPYPWLKVPRSVARTQIRTLGFLPNG